MAKLYPPNIEGTIPAFYGTTLVVPFSMNLAVSANQIGKFSLKVKKVNSTEIILTKTSTRFDAISNFKAYFDLTEKERELFNIGQYYRVQLAYIDLNDVIGYYSTVGVIKYTALPEVGIVGMDKVASNAHMYDYIGFYRQIADPTEKLYSCRFILYNPQNEKIIDSGEILHSVMNDLLPNEATEKYIISRDLEPNTIYRLKFTAITTNGLVVSSPLYRIAQRELSNTPFDEIKNLAISAHNNYDQGIVEIRMRSLVQKDIVSGSFLVSRSKATKPYEWERIEKFTMRSEPVAEKVIIDPSIRQGEKYVYSLQQYNNADVFSARKLSNEVIADFEDLFLLDQNRQLKIKFNPKVSSMKNNILESKVNTIGSKYPYITRNGIVNHKEFSLSGLISYQMDDDRQFISWKDLGIYYNMTDLITDNIRAERDFKLEVLKWLTDGKPKVMKSPAEGNYLVRLMGVSLSPNDTVGRMLHSFSCSASEIAPCDYFTLNSLGFLNLDNPDIFIEKWKTISFSYVNEKGEIEYLNGEILKQPIYGLAIRDMAPGSKIIVNGESIYIGATQSYFANVETPIYSLIIPEGAKYTGSITYQYKDVIITEFDKISALTFKDVPVEQYVSSSFLLKNEDLLGVIKDIKTDINEIIKIKFLKRGVFKIYTPFAEDISANAQYYQDAHMLQPITLNSLDSMNLYQIYWTLPAGYVVKTDIDGNIKYVKNYQTGPEMEPYSGYYYDPSLNPNDPKDNLFIEDSYDLFEININDGQFMNISETEEYEAKGMNFISVRFGDGVIAEITYTKQITDYACETTNPTVAAARKAYDTIYQQLIDYREGRSPSPAITSKQVHEKYKNLCEAVEKAVLEEILGG